MGLFNLNLCQKYQRIRMDVRIPNNIKMVETQIEKRLCLGLRSAVVVEHEQLNCQQVIVFKCLSGSETWIGQI